MKNFFLHIEDALIILWETMKIFIKFPIMILPVLIPSIISACATWYFEMYFDWDNIVTFEGCLSLLFLVGFVCIVTYSFGSLVMLEMIEQIETNKKLNFFSALFKAFNKDFFKAFPVMAAWAFLWFILDIIDILIWKITRKNKSNGFIEFAQLWIQMFAFYTYPAIVWENKDAFSAIKKSSKNIENQFFELLTGLLSVRVLACIVAFVYVIVVLIVCYYFKGQNIKYSALDLKNLLIFICFARAFIIYIQQMFVANLYMWNMKWERAVIKAYVAGEPKPYLSDVEKPSLLDDIPDLLLVRNKSLKQ